MGIYNIIHGRNPGGGFLLSLLEIPEKYQAPPRFRDIWHETVGRKIIITLLARQGGGNRESYHTWNEMIAKHPQFIKDEDGSYPERMDSTYNFISFDGEPFKELLEFLEEEKPDMSKEAFLERLKEITSDIKHGRETPLDNLIEALKILGDEKK